MFTKFITFVETLASKLRDPATVAFAAEALDLDREPLQFYCALASLALELGLRAIRCKMLR